jgi:hypothetical protein
MGTLTAELREFLDSNPVGVLATLAPDGEPRHLSSTSRVRGPTADFDAGRPAQARDTRRTGWTSLCVMGREPPYPSATLSGPAEIVTENIGHQTASISQRITRAAGASRSAERPGALAEAGPVILAINDDRVTAANYISEATRRAQS